MFVLLNDIENHKHLFTRENYVCYDGIPYDENSACGDKVAAQIAYRHSKYDELSVKSNRNRSRNDAVAPEYFRKLKDKFGTFERLKNVADKFIAHALSINKQISDIRYNDTEEVLKEFDKCYKDLICILKRISTLIDEVSIPLSVSTFDQFEGVNVPIITRDDHKKLESYWGDREEQIQKWLEEKKGDQEHFLCF